MLTYTITSRCKCSSLVTCYSFADQSSRYPLYEKALLSFQEQIPRNWFRKLENSRCWWAI